MSQEEVNCKQHYNNSFKRDLDGRFIISIPFKIDPNQLGESRSTAASRLISLEKQFARNKELKISYHVFMQEYKQMDHMTKLQDDSSKFSSFYLPLHCVLRPTSTSTELRVVFDSSVKSDSRISLNDW